MRKIIPLAMLAAVALVATGLMLAQRDPAAKFTENRSAWQAYEEGERLLQSFRYAEAVDQLERAVAEDPSLAMAHLALATVHGRLGESSARRMHLAVADSLASATEDDESRMMLQLRMSTLGVEKHAAHRDSLLALAKASCPDHIMVLVIEANDAARSGDAERAEKIWQHVLEINPSYAAAYNYLGYMHLNQGDYDEAEAAMRRYAFVAPDLANPHDSLGDVLRHVGRYEEALQEYKWALAKQPDFHFSTLNIARIYYMRGEVDKANQLVDVVREEVAGTEMVHEASLVRLQSLFGHEVDEDLIPYASQYIQEFPKSGWLTTVQFWQAMAKEQPELALGIVDSVYAACQSEPWYIKNADRRTYTDMERLRSRALVAEAVGDHAAASQLFRQVLEITAAYPPHERSFDLVHLAWNLAPIGGFDEARRAMSTVLSTNPRIPEALLVAAAVEAAADNPTEAHRLLDTLERTMELADRDFPVVERAQKLREQLPEKGQI